MLSSHTLSFKSLPSFPSLRRHPALSWAFHTPINLQPSLSPDDIRHSGFVILPHTSLSFNARATAAARLCTPSFVNKFRVCVLVV